MAKRSWVWEFCSAGPNDQLVECNVCKEKFNWDNKTNNIVIHLKKHIKTQEEYYNTCPDLPPYDENNERKKMIDSRIVDHIITDLQPFSIVEDTTFIELMKILNQRYQLPNKELLETWVDKKYEEYKQHVQNELNNVNKICVTTDLWTNINTEKLLTVTCHFVNNQFKLKTYTLETIRVIGSNMREAILGSLRKIFDNWQLRNKVATVVTDNDQEMKGAIEQLEPKPTNIPCFVHTLNLIGGKTINDIPEMGRICKKCVQLVSHLEHCPGAVNNVWDTQNQDIGTKWYSICDMLERLIEQKSEIISLIPSIRCNCDMLTEEEWKTLETIIDILKILRSVIEDISSAGNVSLSQIVVLKKQINSNLRSYQGNVGLQYSLQQQLINYITSVLTSTADNHFYLISTLLDPRYKKLGFLNDECISRARHTLLNIANKYINSDVASTSRQDINIDNQAQKTSISLWLDHDKEVEVVNKNATSSAERELIHYLELEDYLKRTNDPLLFWSKNSDKYPILSKIAREYLCIMGTSVSAERMFLKEGNIINLKRNSLETRIVNKILFLNSCKHNLET